MSNTTRTRSASDRDLARKGNKRRVTRNSAKRDWRADVAAEFTSGR